MPWFWSGKPQPTQFDNASAPSNGSNTAGQQSGDQQLTKAEKKAMEAYRFDSSALERAAEAAKTLERSSNDVTIHI